MELFYCKREFQRIISGSINEQKIKNLSGGDGVCCKNPKWLFEKMTFYQIKIATNFMNLFLIKKKLTLLVDAKTYFFREDAIQYLN